jgi:hypothetical protein
MRVNIRGLGCHYVHDIVCHSTLWPYIYLCNSCMAHFYRRSPSRSVRREFSATSVKTLVFPSPIGYKLGAFSFFPLLI